MLAILECLQVRRTDDFQPGTAKQFNKFLQGVLTPVRGILHAISIIHLQEIRVNRCSDALPQQQLKAPVELCLVWNCQIKDSFGSHDSLYFVEKWNRVEVEMFHCFPANNAIKCLGAKREPVFGAIALAEDVEQIPVMSFNATLLIGRGEFTEFIGFSFEDRDILCHKPLPNKRQERESRADF